jgi:hypothetical protein
MSKIRIALATAAAALALTGGIACGGGATPKPTDPADHTTAATRTPTARPSTTAPTKPVDPPTSAVAISKEQQNAARSAKSYLAAEDFSRAGLIRQLSSDAGDGYSVKAATAAVDSLHVDWNEQAVKSAKAYLAMQGFSRTGLIQQLESSSGDGYTHAQAVYGATKAGL